MHLFFDIDNTLWDFDLNSYNVLQQLFIDLGLENKINVDFDSFHVFYKKRNDELWAMYYKGQIAKPELRYKRFYDSLINFGLDDVELSKHLSDEYIRISPYSKALMPGCFETLGELSKKHKMHIITNGFLEVQNIKLDNCGLRPYFDQIIISEEHGHTKPQVEIFELAEKKTRALKEDCIMIGDNWVSDIEGALGAGWKAVFYKVNERALFEHRNLQTIKHLNELKLLF